MPSTWCLNRRIPTINNNDIFLQKLKTVNRGYQHQIKDNNFTPESNDLLASTSIKDELNRKSDFERIKNSLLHKSFIMFDLQFGVSIDKFLEEMDPLSSFLQYKLLCSEKFLGGESYYTSTFYYQCRHFRNFPFSVSKSPNWRSFQRCILIRCRQKDIRHFIKS